MARPDPQAQGIARSAASKPLTPPPPLAPNIGYGTLNPGTTVPGTTTPMPYDGPGPPGTTSDANPAGAPGGGASGGGDTAPEIDWAQVYFGSYNLPADLIGQIETLGKKYGTSNPDVFFQSAQNLIRQSDWFKTTYPGFFGGVRAGLFTDESGYRSYVNALNQIYRQYQGRDVSGAETAAALNQGYNPALVGNQLQGDVIASTNAPEWQRLTGAFDENGALTPEQLTAAGREQAGIDTPLGQLVQKRLQIAAQRAQKIFSGTLATPSLNLGAQGLNAPSLLGGRGTPDIGA